MIQLLDDKTIDKIAAGEVVEKPASVVKELVENSIDAKAKCITVEIKGGGIDLIRVTDDGVGIPEEEVQLAFQRHATSKIVSDEDLHYVMTLGFRGEALASIAAVSMVEMITTRENSLTGTRIFIEGGITKEVEEVGAPQGTTVKVSQLFFNTPARRKFLKTAATEGAYIVETMQHMALSRPDLSFKMIVNGQIKFHTSGSNDLREVIYKIYGRDTAKCLIPIDIRENDIVIEGYLGKPELNRGNRNCENYYVNRRYVKSNPITHGIEEGYKSYMMVHRFPFCVLHIEVDTQTVDVNVHPAKMQVRLSNNEEMTELLIKSIHSALSREELIPKVALVKEKQNPAPKTSPEPFEKKRIEASVAVVKSMAEQAPALTARYTSNVFFDESLENEDNGMYNGNPSDKDIILDEIKLEDNKNKENNFVETRNHELFDNKINDNSLNGNRLNSENINLNEVHDKQETSEDISLDGVHSDQNTNKNISFHEAHGKQITSAEESAEDFTDKRISEREIIIEKAEQSRLWDNAILQEASLPKIQILGQVFDTYWIVTMGDSLYFMDQHAAHEKVKYEEFMEKFRNKEVLSQNLMPPEVISLQPSEYEAYLAKQDIFKKFSFEIEEFGGTELLIHAVPLDFYGCSVTELFDAILHELMSVNKADSITLIEEKIATMACKAAVKGNTVITREEAEELIRRLMTLDQPYHCPHGRPTMIEMSKYELEKKFKRIV